MVEGGGGSGSGTKDRAMLSIGFVNCRGWWSREVDMKLLLELKRFSVLGLAETFLKPEEVSMTG